MAHAPRPRAVHWWPTLGIMLGGLAVAMSQGSLNVAIPSMMSSLGTDLDRMFPPETRGLALGLYNFSNAFGPAIAPALGGYLIEVFNWRTIMYRNVPFGPLSAALVLLRMPPSPD